MRILHVVHAFPPEQSAGAELYTRAIARRQAALHDVAIFTAETLSGAPDGTVVERRDGDVLVASVANRRAAASLERAWNRPDLEAAFGRFVGAWRPDVVHFQHLMNHSAGYPGLARSHGAATVMTLHDFWMVCGRRGQMLRAGGARCDHAVPEECAACLSAEPAGRSAAEARAGRAIEGVRRITGIDLLPLARRLRLGFRRPGRAVSPGDLAGRVRAMGRVAGSVQLFTSPSRFLMDVFIRHGFPADRIVWSPNGIETGDFEPGTRPPGARLRVGFVGTLAEPKGLHVLVEAARLLPSGGFEFHVHGDDRVRSEYAAAMRRRARGLPVTFHGAFAPGEAGRIYAGLDVLVVPSIWFENAPLTVLQAFAAAVPPLASRLGGLREMIRDGDDGLLFETGDAADLARTLERCRRDSDLLPRLAAARPQVRSVEEDAATHVGRYRTLRGEEVRT